MPLIAGFERFCRVDPESPALISKYGNVPAGAMASVSMAAIPSIASMRDKMTRAYNQKQSGSCSAFATLSAVDYLRSYALEPHLSGAQLINLTAQRLGKCAGHVDANGGFQPDDGSALSILECLDTFVTGGIVNERDWPFDESQWCWNSPPNMSGRRRFGCRGARCLFQRSDLRQPFSDGTIPFVFHSVINLIRVYFASGYPVLVGIAMNSGDWAIADNGLGRVSMPSSEKAASMIDPNWKDLHAILITGYDDSSRLFEFKNSWGAGFGDLGYGYLPYEYIDSFSNMGAIVVP